MQQRPYKYGDFGTDVDRLAAAGVESRTAKALQEGMHTPAAPDVDVRGSPS
ncbi:hypothetical protein [Streptomyces sp. NPDC005538]|uniref:hypothetical protein n=1 Tax=unclassified Streptomyces TaxID=2593676 RepID=UPI0033B6222E